MKRKDLVRHLESHDCVIFREGGKHSVFKNLKTGSMTSVPRHREIKQILAKKICDDLGVPRQ